MGDLNYRTDMDSETAQKCLEKNDLESMLENDQFILEQAKGFDVDNFFEGKIDFFPTYKYKIGSDNYDLSDRVPSWTDRIIFKSKLNYDLIQLDYKTINDIRISDHKPVFSVFKILVNEKISENDFGIHKPEIHYDNNHNSNNFDSSNSVINGSPFNNNKSEVCFIF